MGKYDPWDSFFAMLDGSEQRFSFRRLQELSGVSLPPSAFTHPAWWSGAHYYAKWRDHGWYARPRLRDDEVVFTRTAPRRGRPRSQSQDPGSRRAVGQSHSESDLILLGCVAQKRSSPAPARDLYTSPLWRKRRAYAEASEKPWLILSAEHGLLDPDRVTAPYDRYLESQPREYRQQWSVSTADRVIAAAETIGAKTVEVHAGAAYLDHGLIEALERAGLTVERPLQGLRIGAQLAWYGSDVARDAPGGELSDAPAVPITADHVLRIADDYASGRLGESWGELPETGIFRLPKTAPIAARLWLTFICAVDRARDAEALWNAGLQAWADEPWVFDPAEVVSRPFWRLADALRTHRLSQRHAQDSSAWRTIAETLVGSDCPPPIRDVLDGGPAEAAAVLEALGGARAGGTRLFPLLSGPKIGPMWVRIMAYPGRAEIRGMDVIPVAVDTHVQRVTEMLGLVATRELDDRHRREIQDVWFVGVREAGPFGGPPSIDGTAAALDPALWVLGKNGCSRCETNEKMIKIGSICDLCPLGRVALGDRV